MGKLQQNIQLYTIPTLLKLTLHAFCYLWKKKHITVHSTCNFLIKYFLKHFSGLDPKHLQKVRSNSQVFIYSKYLLSLYLNGRYKSGTKTMLTLQQ